MSAGSVRDRIAALQGSDKGHSTPPTARRGHKLSLKTDEHIKEEFLRRGDGGWSKKVDIGQQQPFMAPPSMPFIKVTAETPVVPKPKDELPGKLPKDVPGSFESIAEAPEPRASGPSLAEQRSVEQQKEDANKQDVPVSKYESLLDEEVEEDQTSQARDRSRSRTAPRKAYVEDHDEGHETEVNLTRRERVIFDPVSRKLHKDEENRSRSKQQRRKSYQHERRENHAGVDVQVEEQSRARSRSSRPQIKIHNHFQTVEDANHEHHKRRPSRSRSRHEDHSEASHSQSQSSPESARRSSSSLWPSFSQQERRSLSEIFDTASTRPRSSHSKTRSEVSTTSTRTEISPKKLEFAEYVAGKKLDHLPKVPLKPPQKPLGYVRSRSSNGEYSEYYTREKRLLRKPDENEIIEHLGHDRGRKERLPSWHADGENEPWQVKIMQGIARM